jgi:hypothetical protein
VFGSSALRSSRRDSDIHSNMAHIDVQYIIPEFVLIVNICGENVFAVSCFHNPYQSEVVTSRPERNVITFIL